MKIKCIALDMDRTTLNSVGALSQRNKEAIEAAIGQGIHIVIASGRAYSTLPKEVTEIEGIEYAVTSNGAAVYHLPTGNCLKQFKVPSEAISPIVAATRQEPIAYEVFIDGKVYTDSRFVDHPERYGLTREAVDYFQDARQIKTDMEDFVMQSSSDINTLNLYVANDELKQRVWKLVEDAADGIHITTSFAQLIEVVSKDAGKDAGLRFITEYLGLKREETAAFGDNDNDMEMLDFAGYGIAMENATEKCKAAADYYTIHHDADGVAHGFREILGLDV